MEKERVWLLERIASERFPYRIRLLQGNKLLLALKVQSKWPGSGTQVFCLRDETPVSYTHLTLPTTERV